MFIRTIPLPKKNTKFIKIIKVYKNLKFYLL